MQKLLVQKRNMDLSPPVLADISQDGYYDIIAISHGSNIFAIDGKDQRKIWTQSIKNTECSNSFAVGYFTDDKIPDLFTFVSKGASIFIMLICFYFWG